MPTNDPVDDFSLSNLGFQVRYRWEFKPLSYLYVVYGRGGDLFNEFAADDSDALARQLRAARRRTAGREAQLPLRALTSAARGKPNEQFADHARPAVKRRGTVGSSLRTRRLRLAAGARRPASRRRGRSEKLATDAGQRWRGVPLFQLDNRAAVVPAEAGELEMRAPLRRDDFRERHAHAHAAGQTATSMPRRGRARASGRAADRGRAKYR